MELIWPYSCLSSCLTLGWTLPSLQKKKSSQFRSCVVSYNLPLDSSKRQTPPFTQSETAPPPDRIIFLTYRVIFPACNSPLSYLEHFEKKKPSFVLCRFCPWIASWLCGHHSVELSHNTDKDYLRAGKERMEEGRGAQKRGNGAGFAVGGKQHAVFVSWSSISELLGNTIIGDSIFFLKRNKQNPHHKVFGLCNHSFSLGSVCGLRGAVLMCEGINCATRWFQPQMQGSFRFNKTV